jgi:hypothetical protein
VAAWKLPGHVMGPLAALCGISAFAHAGLLWINLPSPLSTFHPFPRLPFELRDRLKPVAPLIRRLMFTRDAAVTGRWPKDFFQFGRKELHVFVNAQEICIGFYKILGTAENLYLFDLSSGEINAARKWDEMADDAVDAVEQPIE